jgi:alcohol dehydrogenase YqhD (iron-dependent ADH family)
MLDGVFHNPTKIIFGQGTLTHLGAEAKANGSRALIVAGGASFRLGGLADEVFAQMDLHNIPYTVLTGVRPNPTADRVYEGIDLCRTNGVDIVIAVGGGSVIDTAKSIAIGSPYGGDFFDFYRRREVPRQALNVGVVLTVAGAGSESSDGAVITLGGDKYSCGAPVMYPRFAILDPSRTMSVPPFQTACGIVDATAHVLERYFTHSPDVLISSRLCEGLLSALITLGTEVLERPTDYPTRSEIMWACKLAHDGTIGFGRKADWATHTIAHEVAARYDTVHGATLAVLFPSWMRHMLALHPTPFATLARNVFGVPRSTSDRGTGAAGIEAYRGFLNRMGMPSTLRDLGLTDRTEFRDIALACCQTTPSGTIGHFKRLDSADIESLLTDCF